MSGDTYLDGVATLRCRVCHAALRAPDGAPVVALRTADVEDLVCFLIEHAESDADWHAIIARCEQALGRTYAQITQARTDPPDGAAA
jgi:hypothetical protein